MKTPQKILIGITLGSALLGGAAWLSPPAIPTEPTMTNVIHLNGAAFPKLLTQSKPVIIDFWAPWCGPCRTQGPILDQVSLLAGDRAIVTKVNVDEEQQLAAQFGVQSIPTLVILRSGKVIKQFVGVQQANTLLAAIDAPAS